MPIRHVVVALVGLVLCSAALVACSSGDDGTADESGASSAAKGERFPDVEEVEVSGSRESLDFSVTMTSPYDTPDRYADGMRVRSADGKSVYATKTLAHDHASEQPFTRPITGVRIPADVNEVVVEGHDQVSGWGGATKTVTLDR